MQVSFTGMILKCYHEELTFFLVDFVVGKQSRSSTRFVAPAQSASAVTKQPWSTLCNKRWCLFPFVNVSRLYAPLVSNLEEDSGAALVWEGHGLVSWILEADEKLDLLPLVNGRLFPQHIEVQLELQQTQRVTKKTYYDGLIRRTLVPMPSPSPTPLPRFVRQEDAHRLVFNPIESTADKSSKISSPSSSSSIASPHLSVTTSIPSSSDDTSWEHRPLSQPPIRFHAVSAHTVSPRKRKRSPSSCTQLSVIPVSDPNSAHSVTNHWSMDSHTTATIDSAPIIRPSPSSSSNPPVIVPPLKDHARVCHDDPCALLLPFSIDAWTIHSLGHIVWDRPAFYDEQGGYIYPVGYKVKRWYKSRMHPKADTQYVCEITDGGDGPIFRLEADDNPGIVHTGSSPAMTLQRAFGESISEDGHDFFGLSNKTIAKLIEDLPSADKCPTHIWKKATLYHHHSSRESH
ncbi:hypothetical protein [Absidia glauca]|uniref:FYR N-terminal domain-containing protein n=1 Tax=Absidia glauca TaxID=4829 RepID=A0A163IXB6_ABSGL|nr:hypothetical protein [Absidia glauca]